MIKLTTTFRSICAATIAAGVLAGFVVRCDEPLVQEPRNENPAPRRPSGSASNGHRQIPGRVCKVRRSGPS